MSDSSKCTPAFWPARIERASRMAGWRPIAWIATAAKTNWASPAKIKRQLGSTIDFVGDNRVIIDLGSNKYLSVVHVSSTFGRVDSEYDRIDPEAISW